MEQVKNGILTTAIYNFDVAANRLGLAPEIRQKILGPKERIEIDINPKLPNGRMINAKVFVVRHHDALGPAKGGIRMTPTVNIDEVTGLAMEMTWKTSLIGVPFGGGKSGIRLDPSKLTEDEKEAVIRAFERGASRHIGPEIYIPAPDMGTNEMDMAHIRDCISYSQGVSITKGCFVTGKPVILGGIVGRREATGKGVVYTILSLCEKLQKDISKMTVAVQGFGNVGAVAAAEIARRGARVVAVCDVNTGLTNNDGIDVEALNKYFSQNGTLKGFPGCKEIVPADIFGVDCDILIPAAAGSQITLQNVNIIKASIIAEGANAPTVPAADEVLAQRSVTVVPDILCNAGGVFVSYLEYTQETQREQMTLEEVEDRLSSRMAERFNYVYDMAMRKSITMRQAAMDIAVSRVLEAVQTRGLLP